MARIKAQMGEMKLKVMYELVAAMGLKTRLLQGATFNIQGLNTQDPMFPPLRAAEFQFCLVDHPG